MEQQDSQIFSAPICDWAGRLSSKLREAEVIAAEGGAYIFAQRLATIANALSATQDIASASRMCNASKLS